MWFFGLRNKPPHFGRFTYFEKFGYWAVFWGGAIFIITGLTMWFPDITKLIIPSASLSLFDSFKEAHAGEAILLVLVILIWHFYNVHLRPGKFPGSSAWIHGRVTREEMVDEHPHELETDFTR
ncbi:hypothetical protein ES705_38825 [subsurface metagenome]